MTRARPIPAGASVAIVGSRGFPDLDAVVSLVWSLPDGAVVISGGAEGVDEVAVREARRRGLDFHVERPEWPTNWPTKRDREAIRIVYLERNRRIAEMCDRMVAFWHAHSGGTANAVTWAVALGKPVEVRMPR